jgi:KDO2-lipid IV(A) lauroyltransferase
VEPSFQQLAQRPEFDKCGLVVVGLHLSNFDLILQWLCKQGMKPLILTIPNPAGGRRMEYEMRKRIGIKLLPASVSAFRQALKHLQQGGMVVTGIDRPIPTPQARPRFFGRPAALHMHHIFLATKAHVPIVVAATTLDQDGKYHVFASDFLEMDSHPDPEVEMLRNAEKVLRIAEEFIRRAPQQWSVPLPVWPEVMDLVPK